MWVVVRTSSMPAVYTRHMCGEAKRLGIAELSGQVSISGRLYLPRATNGYMSRVVGLSAAVCGRGDVQVQSFQGTRVKAAHVSPVWAQHGAVVCELL